LQQTDWFKTVQQDIEQRSYFVVASENNNSFSSTNNAQNLKTSYGAEKFVLAPFIPNDKGQSTEKGNWKLDISLQGIYADNRALQDFNAGKISSANSANDVDYTFSSGFVVQYHNDAKGVRQNFIIQKKPVAPAHDIRVSLKAEGDWSVNKVHDTELHFSKMNDKGMLESKIVYNDLKAWDANGKSLLARMEVKGDNNFEIIAHVENAAYPVTIDPLSSTPSSTLAGFSTNSSFGGSVASAGDINGDGYSDVLVGAPQASSNAGAVYIYLGSASGLSTSPSATITDATGGDKFGTSVAGIGDINGDGYSDVLIGAPGVSASKGAVYFFLGSSSGIASGTSASASVTLSGNAGNDNFGFSVANAGDVNGDGFSDVIVGAPGVSSNTGAAYIYTGSTTFTSSPTLAATLTGGGLLNGFGWSVASAGDVNGDGYSDVIVGAPGVSSNTGAAYIFNSSGGSGIASGTSASASGTINNGGASNDGFGWSVASAGDVNGDGYSDVVVGAPGVSTNTGAAYIFKGSSSGIVNNTSLATTLNGAATNNYFGFSVSGAGDMNGDAYADIIIGAYGASLNNGAAYVYEGTSSGIANAASPALTINGASGGKLGAAVQSAGDVNGDGYSDVLIGSPNLTTATGAVYAYIGNPDGSTSTNTLSMIGEGAPGDRYGLSVSSAGDVNGDGYNDVVIGSIGYSFGALNGAAFLYYGSPTGLNTTPSILNVTGLTEEGWSVAAGDINGDGYSDLIVGAKQPSPGGTGHVYFYKGSASGIANWAAPDMTLNGATVGGLFGGAVASADINGDGYSDVIIGSPGVNSSSPNVLPGTGAVYIYNGSSGFFASAPAISATLQPSTNNQTEHFGISLSNAGDVNGDGYADIVIGAPGTSSNTGVAYVYKGGKSGIANGASPDYTLSNGTSNLDFGISVANAGDVNGDGYGDIIVGASSFDNNTSDKGAAEIFLGSSTGPSASTILNGVAVGDEFGASVASAGDVNGDGYSDVIVRATEPSSSNPLTGESYIFSGSPSGISSTIATTFSDEKANTYLETPPAGPSTMVVHNSVAGIGDVNGDGYSDVIIGQYTDATSGTKTGKVYIYYGNNNSGRNASNVLKLYQPDFSGPINVANLLQNNFGLGLSVQSPFGAVKGKLVWETKPNGTAFSGVPITNNITTSGSQPGYISIPAAGTELKAVIAKSAALATKVRVRIKYAPTAVTFGQIYSPWIYSQTYLLGNSPGVLPLDLISFTATPVNQDIVLNWKASGENDLNEYVIEHSDDKIKFDSIGYVTSNGTMLPSSYAFTHYHPSAGTHYYRLKEVDKNGRATFSSVVFATIAGSGVEFNIYPNPATDHITIVHKGVASSMVRIVNSSGAVVGQYQLNNNNDQTTISLIGYAKGSYFVQLVNSLFAPKQVTVK
ncbi:MAG: FG-GAP repeat protein, partial [Bacteroidetes bacterium]|nr:FG-GAP repeat protein [Bacteroidota bacterium]